MHKEVRSLNDMLQAGERHMHDASDVRNTIFNGLGRKHCK